MIVPLTIHVQNLLQSDCCQFECEVVASQSWKRTGQKIATNADFCDGEQFLWVGKTLHKIRNLQPNETKSIVLKANLTHTGIFNLNRFKINIK